MIIAMSLLIIIRIYYMNLCMAITIIIIIVIIVIIIIIIIIIIISSIIEELLGELGLEALEELDDAARLEGVALI